MRALSKLHTISQGRIIVALAASTHWHILTYKFPPVKLVTLPWPWFIDFCFIIPLLLKEEWDVRPVPHISQMQWREVAVTQQASPLNLLWVTCLAYDLYTMTFTHFSVKIHWGGIPLIHTPAVTPHAVQSRSQGCIVPVFKEQAFLLCVLHLDCYSRRGLEIIVKLLQGSTTFLSQQVTSWVIQRVISL